MAFDIQFSEHGPLSHIVRGVQMVLALDALDEVTVRFDCEGAPWRHFFSGPEQLHLRHLSRDIRTPHSHTRLLDADVKHLLFCSAGAIAQDVSAQTWLVTTGGTITATTDVLERYAGHIEVSAAHVLAPDALPLRVPVGICTSSFVQRPVADDGILVVGSGDAQADCTMLDMLAACGGSPVTLFDVYTQHVKRKMGPKVRVVEVQDPAGRAKLYASCRFVVSGDRLAGGDDHFVSEATFVGCAALWVNPSGPARTALWTTEALGGALTAARAAQRAPKIDSGTMIGVEDQAARIAQLICQPAQQPPWAGARVRQYCEAHTVVPSDAHIAWVHCGPDAVWDEACVQWLAQSKYTAIYVDTQHSPLIFSSIFTAMLSQQLMQPRRAMPQVQGDERPQALHERVASHLREHPTSRCDVLHLSCSLPWVLSTRRALQSLDAALAAGQLADVHLSDVDPLPMVFANVARPLAAGELTAKVIGAADTVEQVLRGVMHDAPARFALSWLRRAGARTHTARIYYYPFEQTALQRNEQLAPAQVRQGLQNGGIDALIAAVASSTAGLMQARQAWAQKTTPIVTLLQALPSPQGQYDGAAQTMLCEGQSCDLYVAPSQAVLEVFQRQMASTAERIYAQTGKRLALQGDVQVIPYGVDISAFSGMHKASCRHLMRLPYERVILLCVGRFNREEACDLLPLLIALQQVVQAGHAPLLVLAGHDYDYGYSGEVQAAISSLGLGDFVEVHKNLEAKQKSFLYGASDILLSVEDSIHHTFSASVIEAMAAGLPVIASAWGGHKEVVIAGETGLLVPTRWTSLAAELDVQAALGEPPPRGHVRDLHESIAVDVDALAHAMTQLCDNEAQRQSMGQAGYRHVCQHYDSRKQSRLLSEAIAHRIDMARTQAQMPAPPQEQPLHSGIFAAFSGYAADVLDARTLMRLTPLSQDRARLDTLLSVANFGDGFELRHIDRIIDALSQGPVPASNLADAAGDMRRVLRALKYGLVQVVE